MRKFALSLICLLPVLGIAQTLSTTTPNNGSGGVFMELTPSGIGLNVRSFQTYFSSTTGTPVAVEVYTRPGSYAGFTASSAGWTLSETANAVSAGTITLSTPMMLVNPILLPSGQTTSVYLHAITVGGGIRYTGTGAAPPQTTWSNADLTLFSDVSRTGAVAFAGTQFTPRTFAGNVNYTPVPEPATIAALGLGAAALLRRRRARQSV
ncbi:MAG: PEP-CTERM sorting domain-containing protein [Fimbriimonadaceae bacterium]